MRTAGRPSANLEGHAHRPVLDQLQHHGLLAAASVEAAHVVVLGRVDALAALGDGAPGVAPSVREARLVHDAEVLRILSNQVGEASVAAWGGRASMNASVAQIFQNAF